jgi:hypothetical protein
MKKMLVLIFVLFYYPHAGEHPKLKLNLRQRQKI